MSGYQIATGTLGLLLAGGVSPARAQADKQRREPERLTLEQMLQRLPRRVNSKEGVAGDMVNFLVIGSKEKMEEAVRAAAWVETDRDPQQAILHAIQSTLGNKGYTELPMSLLYLFGRSQDRGFSWAMPLAVAAERHHFRLWQAPWQTSDGQIVWVGAGTHNIGIERDLNGKLTHRSDPEVDKERDFIADTLKDTEKVKEIRYLRPADPVLEATTATGGSYHSDGRVLVVILK